jgi:transcriptional regulator with XRE-family HTH domain
MPDGTFADAAKEALRERHMSLGAAARAMNYDPAYLSRALSGKQLPSPQLARTLNELLGAEGKLAALAAATNGEDNERVARSVENPSRMDGGRSRYSLMPYGRRGSWKTLSGHDQFFLRCVGD